MRAVAIIEPGGHEVLDVIELDVPEPGPGEVRVAVAAAAVSPADCLLRVRGNDGVAPAPWVPGWDAAGVVDAVGPGVERLTPGQPVMAVVYPLRAAGGAQAERLVAPAASVVPIPDGVTTVQAATLPMNGLTARLGLEELGLSSGQTLAVSGGAGLLASYVIGMAKELGVRVIADARPDDAELVRSLGADEVVARGDFAAAVRGVAPDGVDGVFDTAVLNEGALGAVCDGGAMVTVRGFSPDAAPRGIRVTPIWVSTVLERTDWLDDVARLGGDGRLTLRVGDGYAPEQAGEAHRRLEAGGRRARDVIVF